MTTWKAQPCGCKQDIVIGVKRERVCEHGYIFQSEKAAKPQRRKSAKRSEPKRIWDDARAKVDLEGRCRVCGREGALEAAHIMGRKHDEPAHSGTRDLYVNPLRIVPLCGTRDLNFGVGCHHFFDAHELDLLPYLAIEEQVKAVEDAGGIEPARKRLAPSAYRLEVLA